MANVSPPPVSQAVDTNGVSISTPWLRWIQQVQTFFTKFSFPGTTSNDNAVNGTVGEFQTSTVPLGSAVSLVTATAKNVVTLSLTAGDWDLRSQVDFSLSSATTSLFQAGASLTTNTLPGQAGGSGLGTDALHSLPLILTTSTTTTTLGSVPVRLSISATTTLYLVALATFSAGSVTAYGTISARRVR